MDRLAIQVEVAWAWSNHEASIKHGYACNEMIAKFGMSERYTFDVAFCRYHRKAQSLSVCVCGRYTARHSRCVAALVDRELIKTYIENQIEQSSKSMITRRRACKHYTRRSRRYFHRADEDQVTLQVI